MRAGIISIIRLTKQHQYAYICYIFHKLQCKNGQNLRYKMDITFKLMISCEPKVDLS